MRGPSPIVLLFAVAVGAWSCSLDPYGKKAVHRLDLSPDNRYLAAVTQAGRIVVWDLQTKQSVAYLGLGRFPGSREGVGSESVGFRGTTGELLYLCRYGRLCSRGILGGTERELIELGDEQDRPRATLSSDDGRRIVVGTASGRILEAEVAEAESVVRIRKTRDEWSPGGPVPIYTLEGSAEKSVYVTASALIATPERHVRSSALFRPRVERSTLPTCDPHLAEGYFSCEEDLGTHRNEWKEPMWAGITLWRFGSREMGKVIDDDFSDRVRADFSSDGRRFVVREEGMSEFGVYDAETGLRQVVLSGRAICDGVRFLGQRANYLGSIHSLESSIEIHEIADGKMTGEKLRPVAILPLKRAPAGGARTMVASRDGRWFFVGLRDAAVDWYEFIPGFEPGIRHIATLR